MASRATRGGSLAADFGREKTSAASDWRRWARCRRQDPTMFDVIGPSKLTAGNEIALKLCAICPVERDCLEWAERIGARSTIYGGHIFPDFGSGYRPA